MLTLNSDGSFSYVPAADFLGTDSFTYKAVDHFGAVSLSPKTVTLTVAIKAVSAVGRGRRDVSTGSPVSAGDPLRSQVTTPDAGHGVDCARRDLRFGFADRLHVPEPAGQHHRDRSRTVRK